MLAEILCFVRRGSWLHSQVTQKKHQREMNERSTNWNKSADLKETVRLDNTTADHHLCFSAILLPLVYGGAPRPPKTVIFGEEPCPMQIRNE